MIVLLVIVLIYGAKRGAVLGERGSGSPIYEYSFIFMILSFYYSGGNKILVRALILISAMYALRDFLLGGRVTGCQYILVVLLSLYAERLKLIYLLPAAIIVMILMFSIGGFRATLLLNKDITGAILSTAAKAFKNGFVLDTAYSSYHTSMTFLKVLEFHDWNGRLHLFSRWVLSVFLGGRVSDSKLSVYTHNFANHYWGGILPYYCYFYLGIAGIIITLLYLRYIFMIVVRNTGSTKHAAVRVISVYVTCTVLRWWLYEPSQITRGVLLCLLSYYTAHLFDIMSRRRVNLPQHTNKITFTPNK